MAGKDLLSKDLLTKLADAGEEAIGRLAKSPGADQVMGAMQSTRERMDEMQKKVLGIDALEARVVELEKRLAAVEGKKPRSRTTAKPKTTKAKAKPKPAAAPPSAAEPPAS